MEATNQSIRPGIPGIRPFWNDHSYRFIYAPAFRFETVDNAFEYRFTLHSEDGNTHQFTADEPWAPLTPVWNDIPHGRTEVKVEGINENGEVVGVAGERVFFRAAVYRGPYNEPTPVSYTEAGKRGLRALLEQRKFQYWLETGEPDPDCSPYCYPSKEMGAAIRGMAAYAGIADDADEARDALKIAQIIADYVIDKLSIPEGQPLEYLPLVYWVNPLSEVKNQVNVAVNRHNQMMMSEPTRAGLGYLDLYDATKEKRYLEAAVRMARTYAKIKRTDGTWPIVLHRDTGEEIESKPMIPTWLMFFVDRLVEQYGYTEFKELRQEIEQWIVDHPVKNFHWDAQFEDIKIRAPYEKMSYEQASDMAWYYALKSKERPELMETADELLRFVEDQFVVWERPTDGWKVMGLRGTVDDTWQDRRIENWITPAVIEQYHFFIVSRATAFVLRAYGKAYEVTGNEIYRDKARSLGNTLILAQEAHGGGEIPTFPMPTKNNVWTNNSVYTALYLLELGAIV
jgi:maltose/maltodextrin transport system substrate-binding protein